MEYIVNAYSPSKGITMREMQLESPAITSEKLARALAESFARRLSEQRANGAQDWRPRIDTIDPVNHARTA
jgi:hypothetical protein